MTGYLGMDIYWLNDNSYFYDYTKMRYANLYNWRFLCKFAPER